jgi:transcriptional regulator with PAS, ATPase and Fis domain
MPTAVLRAAVWQSIFTCDMRRYQHALYDKLGDITTLIVGPSGTGKELVAQAIGMSRYIAFDIEAGAFAGEFAESYFPLNLSALSPTLIESELFGHRHGAYTGALEDRQGWLEVCPPLGSVFLDEIGEINEAIQVKLLRVLESRVFQRLGETESRQFDGKLIAATNRDLAREMDAGNFRTDLYYRLCSDIIHTPSLHEQLQDMPGELEILVRFLAFRVAGEEVVEALTSEVVEWIGANLGAGYGWQGNVRELEQCVRNIMIRRDYRPAQRSAGTPHQQLASDMVAGSLTADELLSRYCTIVYAQTGSYEAAARQLKLDRRTVKSKIDAALLEQLKDKG